MTTWPADTFWDTSKTEGEATAGWFYKTLDAWKELPGGAEAVTELTISSGSITPTTAFHTVDTEADASTDDLSNIAVTNTPEARRLILTVENSLRTVVLKHLAGGSGQINLAYNTDLILNTANKFIELVLVGTTWYEVSRGGFSSPQPGDFIFLPYEPTSTQLTDRRILEGNGASILDADYPELLSAWGGKIYGNVDATHFNLPTLGGYFPRFFDNATGNDPDRASRTNRGDGTTGDNVGTLQADEYKQHFHQMQTFADVTTGGGALRPLGSGSDTSTSQSGGNETRPKNIYIWGGIYY